MGESTRCLEFRELVREYFLTLYGGVEKRILSKLGDPKDPGIMTKQEKQFTGEAVEKWIKANLIMAKISPRIELIDVGKYIKILKAFKRAYAEVFNMEDKYKAEVLDYLDCCIIQYLKGRNLSKLEQMEIATIIINGFPKRLPTFHSVQAIESIQTIQYNSNYEMVTAKIVTFFKKNT